MPGFDVQVAGLSELKAKLDQLARPKAKRIANKGLRAGAAVYKAEIEQNTPIRHDSPSGTALPPGALKSDIRIKTVSAPDQDSSYVTVGPGRHTEHVMRWLEFGHDQVRNTNLAVGTTGKGRNRRGKGGTVVKHVDAQPIMRRAFESAGEAALEAVAATIRAELAGSDPGGQ